MKKTMIFIITYLTSANLSLAGCNWVSGNSGWILESNPVVTSEGQTDGTTCSHRHSTGRSTYTDSYIVKAPKHGKLVQINVTSFDYTPDLNFKGHDSYSIKLCGTSNTNQKGCATINYEFDIR